MSTGYLVTVFHRHSIVEQFTLIPNGRELHINTAEGLRPMLVVHDQERRTLMIGSYGKFERDHVSLRSIVGHELSVPEDFDIGAVIREITPAEPEKKKPGRKPKTKKEDK